MSYKPSCEKLKTAFEVPCPLTKVAFCGIAQVYDVGELSASAVIVTLVPVFTKVWEA